MAYEFLCGECKANGYRGKVTWSWEKDSCDRASWFFRCERCRRQYSRVWPEAVLESYPKAIDLPQLVPWSEGEPAVNAAGHDQDLSVSDDRIIRYQYSKRGLACLKFVIVDLLPDGQEDFWEQEAGEVCWHSFYPCAAEYAAFHSLIAARKNGEWPLLEFLPSSDEDRKNGIQRRGMPPE